MKRSLFEEDHELFREIAPHCASWDAAHLIDRSLCSAAGSKGLFGLAVPVAQAFLATRLLTIFGGTTEIMKEVIGQGIASHPARKGTES